MFLRALIFISVIASASSSLAEDLPWKETKMPQAKFFPINPSALMRPPIRAAYNPLPANTETLMVQRQKATNGRTDISEEQARKLLEVYAN